MLQVRMSLTLEFWKQYSFACLAKWNDIEESSSRITGLMLLIILGFEFINRGKLQEINLGFAKVEDVSFLLLALPVILAYLFSTLSELLSDADWISCAYEYSFGRVFAADPDGWWRQALSPPSSVLAGITRQDFLRATKSQKINFIGGSTKSILSFIVPLIFEIYAYVQLYSHQAIILTTLSLIVSATLISYGVFTVPSSPSLSKPYLEALKRRAGRSGQTVPMNREIDKLRKSHGRQPPRTRRG